MSTYTSYNYYTFLNNGTFTYTGSTPLNVYYVIVGGGGRGGNGDRNFGINYYGGGGEGGQVIFGQTTLNSGNYPIIVGQGSQSSSFNNITALAGANGSMATSISNGSGGNSHNGGNGGMGGGNGGAVPGTNGSNGPLITLYDTSTSGIYTSGGGGGGSDISGGRSGGNYGGGNGVYLLDSQVIRSYPIQNRGGGGGGGCGGGGNVTGINGAFGIVFIYFKYDDILNVSGNSKLIGDLTVTGTIKTESPNIRFGDNSLQSLTIGPFGENNTAIGPSSMKKKIFGSGNTALGHSSGLNDISGSSNTFIGMYSDILSNSIITNSTALGYNTKVTSSNQIMLGTASETVVVPGKLNVTGTSTLNGATTINNTLNATGTTTLSSATINNNLTVNGIFNIVPPGCIMMWSTETAPSGWLLCDGAAISRSTYVSLFNNIGTTHGVGNGSSTFNIPDCRGIFVRGAGSQTISGKSYSGVLAEKQNDTIAIHTHQNTLTDPGHSHSIYDPGHNHGIYDPGHTHTTTYNYEIYNSDNYSNNTGGDGQSNGTNLINSSFTNITINNNTTDIRNNNNTTSITINNVSAGSGNETYSANITLAYIIKF